MLPLDNKKFPNFSAYSYRSRKFFSLFSDRKLFETTIIMSGPKAYILGTSFVIKANPLEPFFIVQETINGERWISSERRYSVKESSLDKVLSCNNVPNEVKKLLVYNLDEFERKTWEEKNSTNNASLEKKRITDQ